MSDRNLIYFYSVSDEFGEFSNFARELRRDDLAYRLDLPETKSRCVVDLSIAAVEGTKVKVSPQVKAAALRRKDRFSALTSGQSQGIIGESKSGLVVIRMPEKADASIEALVQAENSDRMVIYQALAEKNGTTVNEVQILYAKRLQGDALSGTPIETADGQWVKKIR